MAHLSVPLLFHSQVLILGTMRKGIGGYPYLLGLNPTNGQVTLAASGCPDANQLPVCKRHHSNSLES